MLKFPARVVFLIIMIGCPAICQNASLVSINRNNTDSGDGESYFSVVSANGRYVAFTSVATDLVPLPDNNDSPDVFVRDLKTGQTTLVSVNISATGTGNGGSTSPSISDDGRYIAFWGGATNLVSQSVSQFTANVFLRDVVLGTTTLVSLDTTQTSGGNHNSLAASISGNGRVIAYASVASNLVPNDTNGFIDVFAWDRQTGITSLVSINHSGTNGGNLGSSSLPVGSLSEPQVSADGRIITFFSHSTDLVEVSDTNDTADLFARDLLMRTTTLISRDMARTGTANAAPGLYSLSSNGKAVAFASSATNLAANANGGVFVHNLETDSIAVASVNRNGTSNLALLPSISADGRFVAFMSTLDDLVSMDTNQSFDVFVRDLATGTTSLVSLNVAGIQSGNGHSQFPEISDDGRFVSFVSEATDLTNISDPIPFRRDVFVRDLRTGMTTLASVNRTRTAAANGISSSAEISANGQVVIFESDAADLVPIDSNIIEDVFAFKVPSAPAFDICMVDETNGNSAQLDSRTGEYRFSRCNAVLQIEGKGVVTVRGSVVTLQHNANDRRVLIRIDNSVSRGTATVQLFAPATTHTIIDRNLVNSTCSCA
jgi:Tol biopolymer transport system component